jgi:hypothetical protein
MAAAIERRSLQTWAASESISLIPAHRPV